MTSLKPQRTAFLFRAVFTPIVLLAVLAIGGGVAGRIYVGNWVAAAAGVAWLVLSGWVWVVGVARYRKEQYEVHADRIVLRRGGLLSDEELEVQYANITHVKWIRPWLRHKLFGVGEVYIEVAGSGAGSIAFRDIADSEEAQEEVRQHMQQAFSMSTDELLHEERPAGLGILVDIPLKSGWALVVTFFALSFELLPMLGQLSDAGLEPSSAGTWAGEHAMWGLLAIPVIAIVVGLVAVRCLDLKRRTYRVYNGVIEYHEGFLTRNDAFMPVENLSNSEVTRGIAERITNLYHVVVSCQGAGQEVSFLYLRRGPELNAVLDKLIDQAATSATIPSAVPLVSETAVNDGSLPPVLPPALPPEVACPDLTYRMHVGRTLVPMVGYLLFIPFLILAPILLVFFYQAGMQVIRMLRTTYTLRRSSVEERFDFIQVKQREFSREKITGVVFRENLFDRMFNTITIQFWSIGAGKELSFRNLKKTEELMAAVRERAGVEFDQPVNTIASQHSLGRFICASLGVILFAVLLIVAAIVVGVLVQGVYALLAIPVFLLLVWGYVWGIFYYPRSKLELYDEGLVFLRGIITRTRTCALYRNIKDMTTVKMPGYDCGLMRFNVAGERVAQQNGTSAVPYGFTMRYVPEILSKDELFDYEILARAEVPVPDGENGLEARKALGNMCVRTLLTSIIIFPLIVLLPISLPVALWRASLVRYRIEPGRVLMRKGRLFRSQTSILLTRIDHIQAGRGAVNKLFGNGNIVISTAGSSRPELVLRDVKGHEAFYRALQENHRGARESEEL